MIDNAPFRDTSMQGTNLPASWIKWITQLSALVGVLNDSGTANPTSNLWIGRRFYRTDLTIPVWCSDVAGTWRDATGAIVA